MAQLVIQFYIAIITKTYIYNRIAVQDVNTNSCYRSHLPTSSIMLKRKHNEKLVD